MSSPKNTSKNTTRTSTKLKGFSALEQRAQNMKGFAGLEQRASGGGWKQNFNQNQYTYTVGDATFNTASQAAHAAINARYTDTDPYNEYLAAYDAYQADLDAAASAAKQQYKDAVAANRQAGTMTFDPMYAGYATDELSAALLNTNKNYGKRVSSDELAGLRKGWKDAEAEASRARSEADYWKQMQKFDNDSDAAIADYNAQIQAIKDNPEPWTDVSKQDPNITKTRALEKQRDAFIATNTQYKNSAEDYAAVMAWSEGHDGSKVSYDEALAAYNEANDKLKAVLPKNVLNEIFDSKVADYLAPIGSAVSYALRAFFPQKEVPPEVQQLVRERDKAAAVLQYADDHQYDEIPLKEDFDLKADEGRIRFQEYKHQQAVSSKEGDINETLAISNAAAAGGGAGQVLSFMRMYQNDTRYKEPDERWTDEEEKTFMYLFAEDAENNFTTNLASEYALKTNNRYNSEAAEKKDLKTEEFATRSIGNGVLTSLGSVPANLIGGFADYANMSLETAARGAPYESQYTGTSRWGDTVRGSISQELNQYGTIPEGVPVIGGKGLGDAYQLSMSMVESALAVATGNRMSAVMFFGPAAASGTRNALNRGLSPEKALQLGMYNGIFEVLCEEVSLDKLLKQGSLTDILRNGVWKTVFVQGAIEGSEEFATTFLNTMADLISNRDQSEFYQNMYAKMANGMSYEEAVREARKEWLSDLAYDALGGFISGGFMTGGRFASQLAPAAMTNYNGNSQALLDSARAVGDQSRSAQMADRYQNRVNRKGSLSNLQAFQLQDTVATESNEADRATLQNVVEQRLQDQSAEGLTDTEAKRMAADIVNRALNPEENAAEFESDLAKEVYEDLAQQLKGETKTDSWVPTQDLVRTRVRDTITTSLKNVQVQGSTEQHEVKKATMVDGTLKLTVEQNGQDKEYSLDELNLSDDQKTALTTLTRVLGQDAAAAYNGMTAKNLTGTTESVLRYAAAFASVRDILGRNNVKEEAALKSPFRNGLTDAQTLQALKIGQKLGPVKEEQTTKSKRGTGKITLDGGTLKDGTVLQGVKNREEVENSVRYKQIQTLAEALGVDVNIYQSRAINEEGDLGLTPYGAYEDGVVWLDWNAGVDNENKLNGDTEHMIFLTMSHELTHFLEQNAPEEYKSLRDLVTEYLADSEEVDFNDLVKTKLRQQPNLDYDRAVREVIADACETMLSRSTVVEQIANENPGLFQRIWTFVKDFFDSIRSFFETAQKSPHTAEAKAIQEVADKVSEVWDRALKVAVESRLSEDERANIPTADQVVQAVPDVADEALTSQQKQQIAEDQAQQVTEDTTAEEESAPQEIEDTTEAEPVTDTEQETAEESAQEAPVRSEQRQTTPEEPFPIFSLDDGQSSETRQVRPDDYYNLHETGVIDDQEYERLSEQSQKRHWAKYVTNDAVNYIKPFLAEEAKLWEQREKERSPQPDKVKQSDVDRIVNILANGSETFGVDFDVSREDVALYLSSIVGLNTKAVAQALTQDSTAWKRYFSQSHEGVLYIRHFTKENVDKAANLLLINGYKSFGYSEIEALVDAIKGYKVLQDPANRRLLDEHTYKKNFEAKRFNEVVDEYVEGSIGLGEEMTREKAIQELTAQAGVDADFFQFGEKASTATKTTQQTQQPAQQQTQQQPAQQTQQNTNGSVQNQTSDTDSATRRQADNILISNIVRAARNAGIDLREYYNTTSDLNAFNLSPADLRVVVDALAPVVNQLKAKGDTVAEKSLNRLAEHAEKPQVKPTQPAHTEKKQPAKEKAAVKRRFNKAVETLMDSYLFDGIDLSREDAERMITEYAALHDGYFSMYDEAKQKGELKTQKQYARDFYETLEADEAEAFENLEAESQELVARMGDGTTIEANEDGEMEIAVSEDRNTIAFSPRTYQDSGKAKLVAALKENGHTQEEIDAVTEMIEATGDFLEKLADQFAESHGYMNLKNNLLATVSTNVKTGKQVISTLVNNGDYPVNLDLQLICKKRVAYMHMLTRLIDDGVFERVDFKGSAIADLNKVLRDGGFETACLGCFVEARRLQLQAWAETIVEEWNAAVDKRNPQAGFFNFAQGGNALNDMEIAGLITELENGGKKNDKGNLNLGVGAVADKMGRLLDRIPSLQQHLTVADLLTPQGMSTLREYDQNLFSLVKQRYGANSPKIVQDFNAYNSEIADLSFKFVKDMIGETVKGSGKYTRQAKKALKREAGESKEAYNRRVETEAMRRYLYDIGGARIQSFSDFMIENVFDYMQIIADLSAREFPLHGYSKEAVFLRLFGMTGGKFNGSLIAHVDGSMGKEYAGLLPASEARNGRGIVVEVDGKKYAICFDDYARHVATGSFIQSIGMKDIVALQLDPRYSKNIGSITIGVSDKQILAMLDSPYFRMVIPYHSSGILPEFARLVGVNYYNDYQDYQTTKVAKCFDLDGNPVDGFWQANGKAIGIDTHFDFNEAVQRLGDAKAAADEYLEWCKQRHPVYDGKKLVGYATFMPKFSDSPYGTDFTTHPNYYKLLEDFNVYDSLDEASALQGAVTMTFPSEANRLTAEQMGAYKQALRDTGLYTEKEIDKYAKKADMTFQEIIAEEIGNRAEYESKQAKVWDATVEKAEAMLLEKYGREGSKTQLSARTTQMDRDYMAAVERGDMETAQVLLNRAAMGAGVITNKSGRGPLHLYHGTPSFGFTEFRPGLIFLTDNLSIASGYTANKGYGRKRRLIETYTPDDGDTKTLLKNIKNVLGKKYREANQDDVRRIVDDMRKRSDEMNDAVNDVWQPEEMDALAEILGDEYTDEFEYKLYTILGLPGSINENLEFMFENPDHPITEDIRRDLERWDDFRNDIRPLFVEHHKELTNSAAKGLRDLIIGYDLTDYLIDAQYSMLKALSIGNMLVSENGSLVSKDGMREAVEQAKDIGSYDLYALAGDNPLIIDGKGAFWTNIEVPELGGTFMTDEIGRLAKEKGYTSVQINNIMDSSMNNYASNVNSNVFIFFDSSQVKSADPVTYDDAGNVIPLSERFNSGTGDIRYSARTQKLSDVEKRAVDQFGTTKNFAEAGYILADGRMLRFSDDRHAGAREYDHRAIGRVYGVNIDLNKNHGFDESSGKYLEQFVDAGNIRIEAGDPDLDMDAGIQLSANVPLTPAQEQTIRDFIEWKKQRDSSFKGDEYSLYDGPLALHIDFGGNAELAVFASAHDMNTWGVENLSYEGGQINADRVIQDIRHYYQTGETRRPSIVAQFHSQYSMRTGEKSDRDLLLDANEASMTDAEKRARAEYKAKADVFRQRQQAVMTDIEALDKAVRAGNAAEANKLRTRLTASEKKMSEALAALTEAERGPELREILRREREIQRMRISARFHDSQSRRELRQRIDRLWKDLNKRITNPTEKKRIPVELMQQAIDVLEAINMDTTREGSQNGQKLRDKLNELRARYAALKNDNDFRRAAVYDPQIAEYLDRMIELVGDTPINRMSTAQLTAVFNVLKALDHTARHAVKLQLRGQEVEAYEVSKHMTEETRSVSKKMTGPVQSFFNAQLSPARMFNRFGGYTKNSYWSQIYEMLDDGQLKQTQLAMEGSLIFEDLLQGKDYDRFLDPKNTVDIGLKDDSGNAIPITHGMMVALYMHLQNEQNARHVAYGGLTIPALRDYYSGRKVKGSENAVRVGGVLQELADLNDRIREEEDANVLEDLKAQRDEIAAKAMGMIAQLRSAIESKLTEYDRKWIAASRELFDGFSKRVLNETTMEVYGFKRATVDNYMPIWVDGDFLNSPFESVAKDMSLENAGFMKERVDSSKPIRLADISDVTASQIRKVSQYCGLMPVIRSFNKVWGKTQTGYRDSLQKAVHDTFGQSGIKYIENLMADLNGARGTEDSALGEFLNRMRGHMAQASLTLSLRTALGQTASYPTAASVLGWDALHKAFWHGGRSNRMISRADQELIRKWSPLLYYRMKGFSMPELGDIAGMNSKWDRIWKKARWATGWIQAMDGATVGRLWYAAEYYVQDHNKDLVKGTDAYYEAVAAKFNEAVELTQPNYTTMQRPDILRSPNALVKQLTMFLTQRLQNFNIVFDACATYSKYRSDFREKKNGVTAEDVRQAGVQTRTAVISQVVAAATIVAFKFMADVLLHAMNNYRDDDDELTKESISLELLDMFIDSLAGNVLGGGELYDIIESKVFGKTYYGIEVTGVSTVTDLISAANKVFDHVASGKASVKDLDLLAKRLGPVAGLPYANAKKIVDGCRYWIEDAINGELFSFEAGVDRTTAQQAHRLYRAYVAMDYGQVEKIRAEVPEDKLDDLDTAVRSYIKDQYKAGDMTVYEAARQLQKYGGASDQIMSNFIRDQFTEGNLKEKDAIKMLTQYAGKTEEAATKSVRGWSAKQETGLNYDDIDDQFQLGEITEKQARDALVKYGLDGDKADMRVAWWAYRNSNPGTALTDGKFETYWKNYKPIGLTPAVYEGFLTKWNAVQGTDKNGDGKADSGSKKPDRVKLIDSLPISSSQKDELFNMNWSTGLEDTPWHK